MENKVTYQPVKEIIDTWDPIHLLSMHCPPDEYDIEIKLIYQKISHMKHISKEKLAEIIYHVFLQGFGNDLFCYPIHDCNVIAAFILKEEYFNE